MNWDKANQRENNICPNPKAEGGINCLQHFRDKMAIACKKLPWSAQLLFLMIKTFIVFFRKTLYIISNSKCTIHPLEKPFHSYCSKSKLQMLQYSQRKFSPNITISTCSLFAPTQLDRTGENTNSHWLASLQIYDH